MRLGLVQLRLLRDERRLRRSRERDVLRLRRRQLQLQRQRLGEASSSASSSSSAKPIDCPTENTRKFAKTRFATDIGLTAGTFHRYLWKPYKAGTFQKGADGRTKALIKGGATAALDLKLLDNAVKNAQANPTLCKTIAQPLGTAVESVKNMKGDLTSGNFASIMAANTALSQIMSGSQQQGIKIDETTDESKQNEG